MRQVTDFCFKTFWMQLVKYLTEVKHDYIIARDENTAPWMTIVQPDDYSGTGWQGKRDWQRRCTWYIIHVILITVLVQADVRYISHSSRNASGSVELKTWSVWVYGWGWKCMCGQGWNRSHVERHDLENILTSETVVLMELAKVLHPPDTKYTAIDYLLNRKSYYHPFAILSHWCTILGLVYDQTEKRKPIAVEQLFLTSSNTNMDIDWMTDVWNTGVVLRTADTQRSVLYICWCFSMFFLCIRCFFLVFQIFPQQSLFVLQVFLFQFISYSYFVHVY